MSPPSTLLALSLLTLVTLTSALPTSSNPTTDKRGLLDVTGIIGSSNEALIDVTALANVLGPHQCSANAVVGIQTKIRLGRLLKVCACVEVLNILDKKSKTPCPSCPSNAVPICDDGECGCRCKRGYYKSHENGQCLPIEICLELGILTSHNDGTSSCDCPSPYIPSSNGGCKLPPPKSRSRSKRSALSHAPAPAPYVNGVKAQVVVEVEETDAYRCPNGETACPLGNGGGWECLDTKSSLDSCGGCVGSGHRGVNCLSIPGALSVECVSSVCEIASCFPGWRYLNGRCVQARST